MIKFLTIIFLSFCLFSWTCVESYISDEIILLKTLNQRLKIIKYKTNKASTNVNIKISWMTSNDGLNFRSTYLQWTFVGSIKNVDILYWFKGALSSLRQLLEIESPLKMMKNTFYFTIKALFVIKIFKFLPWLVGHVKKRLDSKYKVNFKIYDVTAWFTHNCNTYIAQHLTK